MYLFIWKNLFQSLYPLVQSPNCHSILAEPAQSQEASPWSHGNGSGPVPFPVISRELEQKNSWHLDGILVLQAVTLYNGVSMSLFLFLLPSNSFSSCFFALACVMLKFLEYNNLIPSLEMWKFEIKCYLYHISSLLSLFLKIRKFFLFNI